MKAFVYYNTRKRCFSVKALSGPNKGRVVAHAHSVGLWRATFKVNEAGRLRVLREGRKNVHAGVVGEVWALTRVGCLAATMHPFDPMNWSRVGYNPRKAPTFVAGPDATPIYAADRVIMAAIPGEAPYVWARETL